MKTQPIMLVHGGAWDIPDDVVPAYLRGIENAVKAGADILESGGTTLDAVEEAVRVMEDDPTFNAGRGSHLTEDGTVQMDAMVMDGRTLRMGAVGAVESVKNPVTLARHVMEHTDHNFLVGGGALIFAVNSGLEIVETEKLIVGAELERYRRLKAGNKESVFGASNDTVGAVAIDCEGNLASATSTGGTPRKHRGRVGDSALPGTGMMAENGVCAVSCTGLGEAIMETRMAEYAVFGILKGLTAEGACREAIERVSKVKDGLAGLIMITADGKWAWDYNTPRMARACIVGNGKPVIEIE